MLVVVREFAEDGVKWRQTIGSLKGNSPKEKKKKEIDSKYKWL